VCRLIQYLNDDGVHLAVDHLLQQFSLISPPQVGQGYQVQAAAHVLHTHALVIRQDGAHGHRIHLKFVLSMEAN